jgi:hypothetical protein
MNSRFNKVDSSDDKEGQAASTKHFAPDCEVFMIHVEKDNEGLDVQLDDYNDDYDSLDQSAGHDDEFQCYKLHQGRR